MAFRGNLLKYFLRRLRRAFVIRSSSSYQISLPKYSHRRLHWESVIRISSSYQISSLEFLKRLRRRSVIRSSSSYHIYFLAESSWMWAKPHINIPSLKYFLKRLRWRSVNGVPCNLSRIFSQEASPKICKRCSCNLSRIFSQKASLNICEWRSM